MASVLRVPRTTVLARPFERCHQPAGSRSTTILQALGASSASFSVGILTQRCRAVVAWN